MTCFSLLGDERLLVCTSNAIGLLKEARVNQSFQACLFYEPYYLFALAFFFTFEAFSDYNLLRRQAQVVGTRFALMGLDWLGVVSNLKLNSCLTWKSLEEKRIIIITKCSNRIKIVATQLVFQLNYSNPA